MSRTYAEPAEVRRVDESPAEFIWRGRLYRVRAVLGHWKEAARWWQAAARGPEVAGGEDFEFWRVQARPGRASSDGVYDLCFDWSVGRWSVDRAYD